MLYTQLWYLSSLLLFAGFLPYSHLRASRRTCEGRRGRERESERAYVCVCVCVETRSEEEICTLK